ncbi:MAG: FecR domain-containing protein [Pseudomonadota bacterium]
MGQGQDNGSKPETGYSHPDPATDEALDWFMRLQDEPVEPETEAAFEEWRTASPDGSAAFDRLQRMKAMPSLRKATEIDATRLGLGPDRLGASAASSRRRFERWSKRIAAVAAAAMIAAGAWQYPTIMLRWQADYITVTGEREKILLPDGSTMTLNTASAVSLDFAEGRRGVSLLAGEAFFDVQHDPAHPFIVAGAFSQVEVKGTAFAVRTDETEDTVVLERGRVAVSRLSDREDQAVLEPGQMIVATASALSAVTKTDPGNALAWLDGRVVFYDRPFPRALDDLRRYYSGTVIVTDSRLSSVVVSGNYRIDDPEAAIRTLAESAGVSTTRLPGGVLILR